MKEGAGCLWEVAAGRGRKPTYPVDKVAAIIESTLQPKPAGATHWSCRTMVKEHGVSKAHREPDLEEPSDQASSDKKF